MLWYQRYFHKYLHFKILIHYPKFVVYVIFFRKNWNCLERCLSSSWWRINNYNYSAKLWYIYRFLLSRYSSKCNSDRYIVITYFDIHQNNDDSAGSFCVKFRSVIFSLWQRPKITRSILYVIISLVFCFSVDPLYHIFLRDDPRFRRNSVPLFSPAVSSSARRFIILFLYREIGFSRWREMHETLLGWNIWR